MVTILYALVESAEGVPLAEAQAVPSVHAASAKKVLASIKRPLVERRCVTYNGYSYDILPHRDGTVYMCVTEESCSRVTSFRFLEAARRHCSSQCGNPASMAAELRKEVELFNDAQSTKIRDLSSKIETVKGTMIANVDKLLSREDRLDALLLQSSALEGESSAFRQNARSLERQSLCRRIAIGVAVALVVIVLLFMLVLMICSRDGVNFDRCRGH
ncbi:putative vesicle-associated membrane protein 713 [Trypanosoma conorhini]|uniref:Putative vesicle-associated membrane protein 713 n=1 Tax=Trypanosoma conorhini TaxID=83891 RepID=A0A3R7LJV8_9TRYP|nr:putative vesicle-associated membrane protein 713 [Trypanosoma conorhini]RNF15909.1 putative vesicle-associated membrane protein 713 [Trypanosoma conorhini]